MCVCRRLLCQLSLSQRLSSFYYPQKYYRQYNDVISLHNEGIFGRLSLIITRGGPDKIRLFRVLSSKCKCKPDPNSNTLMKRIGEEACQSREGRVTWRISHALPCRITNALCCCCCNFTCMNIVQLSSVTANGMTFM